MAQQIQAVTLLDPPGDSTGAPASHAEFEAARVRATDRLLNERCEEGHWRGELCSSALATATAITALALVDRSTRTHEHADLVARGIEWLLLQANDDGGFGDSDRSRSNLSTTLLCRSALLLVSGDSDDARRAIDAANGYLHKRTGGTDPATLAAFLYKRYGADRSFSIPILSMAALADPDADWWSLIKPLPFELALIPPILLRWFRLPVVSYAVPALIAIGQARFHHRPPRNPFLHILRHMAREHTLRRLKRVQPSSGGFIEAIPLTSFVVMSLASIGREDHPVVTKGVQFIKESMRPDGSWPIDSNLESWVTTLSVNALGENALAASERRKLASWLSNCQSRKRHPYADSAPGGWAWTSLPGGIPDADDTAGALLAMLHLGHHEVQREAEFGIRWLLDLQNTDGGVPTFCRGWGKLPFDRSGTDLTVHALRAWLAWRHDMPPAIVRRIDRAVTVAVAYLAKAQKPDGSWLPLWFGNEHIKDDLNPLYGTARVVIGLADTASQLDATARDVCLNGVNWLLASQGEDGGWGGDASSPAGMEETALGVAALAAWLHSPWSHDDSAVREEAMRQCHAGAERLSRRVAEDDYTPSPIGLYFACLWYYEKLYPIIFTVDALQRVARLGPPFISARR